MSNKIKDQPIYKMTLKTNTSDIKELSRDQLVAWLKDQERKPYRAVQILRWIYLHQADTFDEMTDLGKEFRKLLSHNFTINRLEKARIETSQDGSRKYLFRLQDGKHVESVLIPEKDHYTLCISSQVGCTQGCRFCLTAKGGFVRNLSKGEIVAQVRDIARHLDDARRLTNIVLMGMGEPLANYRNVIEAVKTLTDSDTGLGFSGRKITISTAGLVPRLADLGRESTVNLAISLNATDNETRSMLMPINRKYPVEKLLDACAQYPLMPRRKITFEYVLIKGVNDSRQDAERLAALLRPIRAKINLIPFNTYQGCGFERPQEASIQNFRNILTQKNYTVIIRHSKGQDISAACGQLSGQYET
jgi:23S rRNA (adenine2503-C2)-methyltransferase